MVREMPVLTVARMVGEGDHRVWRVINHYVTKAQEAVDLSEIHALGINETSRRRGHDCIFLFVDVKAMRLFFATPEKDAKTFEQLAEDLQAHRGSSDTIREASMNLNGLFAVRQNQSAELPHLQKPYQHGPSELSLELCVNLL